MPGRSAFLLQPQDANSLEQTKRTDGVGVGRVLGLLEGDRHMALGGKIVDLIRLH
jgi:hypothetical protein